LHFNLGSEDILPFFRCVVIKWLPLNIQSVAFSPLRRVWRYQSGIRIRKLKDRQHNSQITTTIYIAQCRKLKIEQRESH
jgi:hypothetical protein